MRSTSKGSIWLFLITFALTFYGMGASFVESFVNYPTWRLIGPGEFVTYHRTLGPLIIGVMVIPLVLTTVLTIALAWLRPEPIPRWAIWVSVFLQIIGWVSTALLQIPIQRQLSTTGLSLPLIDQLIVTNFWFRKVPQIINISLFLWMMSLLLRLNLRRDDQLENEIDLKAFRVRRNEEAVPLEKVLAKLNKREKIVAVYQIEFVKSAEKEFARLSGRIGSKGGIRVRSYEC